MSEESRSRLPARARWVLASVLAGTAILKVVSGRADHVQVSGFVYVVSSIAELALAALLLSRWRRIGSFGALVIAVAGVSHALLARPESCGCAGSWIRSSWRIELVLASLVGALGVLSLRARTDERKLG